MSSNSSGRNFEVADCGRRRNAGAERGKSRANAKNHRIRCCGFRVSGGWKPALAKKPTVAADTVPAAICPIRALEKQSADDPEDVEPVRQIEIPGLDTKIFFCRPHRQIPS
jgi:hypothetical protein